MLYDYTALRTFDGNQFTSCPVASLREPWVAEVWAAWRAYDKGQLVLREPTPSAQCMEAVDLMVSTVAALESRRMKDRHSK